MTQQTKEPVSAKESIRQTRIQKLAELADKGINPYPYAFDKDADAKDLQEKYKDLPAGEETEDFYSVAGRVMAIRNSGMFIDLMDTTGKIQIFSHKENMDPEMVKTLKLVDIGDILGFYGSIRRTPRGELSIKAKSFKMLSKSLLPLPNKQISEEKLEQLKMYHTMSDTETKYRQRYVDLIVNERTRDTFRREA